MGVPSGPGARDGESLLARRPGGPTNPGDPADESSDRADDGLGRPDRTPGPRRARQDQPPGVVAERPARRPSWTRPPPTGARTPAPWSRPGSATRYGSSGVLTNVYPHKTLENVVVHFFIVREEKVGQKELPDLRGDVVLETAFDMDFKPGGKAGQRNTLRIDAPASTWSASRPARRRATTSTSPRSTWSSRPRSLNASGRMARRVIFPGSGPGPRPTCPGPGGRPGRGRGRSGRGRCGRRRRRRRRPGRGARPASRPSAERLALEDLEAEAALQVGLAGVGDDLDEVLGRCRSARCRGGRRR